MGGAGVATDIHIALMAGALNGLGFGRSLGRLIRGDGVTLPSVYELQELIHKVSASPLTAARADLLANHTAAEDQMVGDDVEADDWMHRQRHAMLVSTRAMTPA